MIINSLTLKNFKSHKNTTLNFNNNISIILGSNGAGKSSILEAISYSLFKEFNGKIDELIRKPAEENDPVKGMLVILEFVHNGTTYQLKRGRRGKQNIAELKYKKNESLNLQCSGDRNVNRDITNLLGLDSKSFLNAIYIRQGDITDLIEKTDAERKELISKLLNIDSFERAWNEIKKLQDFYKAKINENEGKLSEKEKIEEDKQNLLINSSKNEEILSNIITELEQLTNKVTNEELELKKIELERNKYHELKDKKALLDEILQNNKIEKEKNEKKLQEIEENENEIKRLDKEVVKLPYLEKLTELKSELDKNNDKIKQYQDEISNVEKNTLIMKEHQDAHDKLQPLTEEIDELKNMRNKYNEEYLKIESVNSQIKEKNNKVKEIRNQLQKASEDATKLFNEYFNSPESIEKKVNDEKEKNTHYIDELTKKINENNSKISVSRNNLKSTEKSLKELELTEDICPICQSEISHDKHEELSSRYKEDINNLMDEIENLTEHNISQKQKLENKKKYLEKVNSIKIDVLKEKNNEFKRLINEINVLKEKIPENYQGKEELNKIDSELDAKEKILTKLQEEEKIYFSAKEKLSDLRQIDIINNEINDLNKINSEFKNKCHEIIVKYAVGDNLALQIESLRKKDKLLSNLQGRVKDKELTVNKIKDLDDDIVDKTDKIKNIESEIKSIDFDDEIFNKKNELYTQNKNNLDEKKTKRVQLSTEIKKDKEAIDKYNAKLNELLETELEQKNLEDYLQLLDNFREIYSKDGVQKDLRENIKPLIEKETMDIFNEFGFDYSGIKLDEDYNVTLNNKNEELNIDMISGGEKIVVALALRLGISKVLSENKTDLLILDEPTIHLDEERRNSLINILREISFVPQMIIVTHDDEMESTSNNIIKIQKQNGVSSIDNS